MKTNLTVLQTIQKLSALFAAHQVQEPRTDAELLVANAIGTTRPRLPLFWSDQVSSEVSGKVDEFGARRIRREPVQYILGEWPFLKLNLFVGPEALIPRPETEEWVEKLLCFLKKQNYSSTRFAFADICTGNGAIGLALASELTWVEGVLSDISSQALSIAAKNLNRLAEVQPRVSLVRADLLSGLKPNSLDFLVANPPYIPNREIPNLMPEVRDHEPKIALDGGYDGLSCFCRILADASRVLRPAGVLALEHGFDQRSKILELFAPDLIIVESGIDFVGNDRYIFWRRI